MRADWTLISLVGALVVWGLWTVSGAVLTKLLPPAWRAQDGAFQVILIGRVLVLLPFRLSEKSRSGLTILVVARTNQMVVAGPADERGQQAAPLFPAQPWGNDPRCRCGHMLGKEERFVPILGTGKKQPINFFETRWDEWCSSSPRESRDVSD